MRFQSLFLDMLFASTVVIATSLAITRLGRIHSAEREQAQHSLDTVETPQNRRARWRSILKRTYTATREDRILAVAGGVTFYGLLALFPATAALVSVYGLVVDSSYMHELLEHVDGALPTAGVVFLRSRIERIGAGHGTTLSFALVISIILALWGANRGIKALFDGLNVAYGLVERRRFLKINAISMIITFGLFMFLVLALWALFAVPFLFSAEGYEAPLGVAVRGGRWPVLFILLFIGVSALYRFGPSRSVSQPKWVTPGALFASSAWITGSLMVSSFLENFDEYNWTFGTLAAVDSLLIWMWLSCINILIGAELNSECER